MRRFVTMSMLVSAVLLAGGICFAQNKQADAAGAKADSPDMWAAYKKMWEGKWETTITTSEGPENKKSEKITATMTDEVILGGNGVLVARVIRNASDEVISEQKGLASWCPRQKVILLRELSSDGAHSDGVIKMVDNQEHHRSTHIDAQGNEIVVGWVVTAIDANTNQLKIIDGPMAGFEATWKRKRN